MKLIQACIACALALTFVACTEKEEPKPVPQELPPIQEQVAPAKDTTDSSTVTTEEKKDGKTTSTTTTKRQEIKSVTTEEKSVRTTEPAPATETNARDTSSAKKVKKLSRPN